MKRILLFGAGKSATVLIDYLKDTATKKQWHVTIADVDPVALQAKVGEHELVRAVPLQIENEDDREKLISRADIVISLLPPALHYLVAVDCIELKKNLLTASYVDEQTKKLEADVKKNSLFFLCEMGLDPGIDHMSAMKLIHSIKAKGGSIVSFNSHCGGLVAPESDDNPWHYKLSWNPKSVVLAGKAGAIWKENGETKQKKYETIFKDCAEIDIDGIGKLACYPNRDSLSYMKTYELEDAASFIRTTLRYPGFCKGWQAVIDLGLTNESVTLDTDTLTIADFLHNRYNKQEDKFLANDPLLKEQFDFIGWNDETLINQGGKTIAETLQWVLEQKWKLNPTDKDMIVMLHELEYVLDGKTSKLSSSLIVKGEDQLHTAMAKTVGLPLGIAATLILEGKIAETGLHIPILPSVYEPVLQELENHGIRFEEA